MLRDSVTIADGREGIPLSARSSSVTEGDQPLSESDEFVSLTDDSDYVYIHDPEDLRDSKEMRRSKSCSAMENVEAMRLCSYKFEKAGSLRQAMNVVDLEAEPEPAPAPLDREEGRETRAEGTFLCGICFEDVTTEEKVQMPCHRHAYCRGKHTGGEGGGV